MASLIKSVLGLVPNSASDFSDEVAVATAGTPSYPTSDHIDVAEPGYTDRPDATIVPVSASGMSYSEATPATRVILGAPTARCDTDGDEIAHIVTADKLS